MTATSCVIIARGRLDHLRRVLVGLGRQTVEPVEVVVVAMGDPEVEALASAHAVVTAVESVPCPAGDPLPLARARNQGASSTAGELLVFLDVDCIPARALVADYQRFSRPGLLMGTVRYLPPGVPGATGNWNDDGLREHGRAHDARPIPTTPERTDRYELFWSLNFAVERATWEAVGGFDEEYCGYGGEDTDFAFEARRRGVDAWFLPGAEAFHQHHPASSPPVEHLEDIVANAERFHRKWDTWPMTGWLEAFAADGRITWTDDSIELVPERSRG